MKNKKIIGLVIVALIGALIITTLIINKAKAKEDNIVSIKENVNEIQNTNEIKDTTEIISDVTNSIQGNVILENNQDETLQTKTKHQEIEKITPIAEKKSVEKSNDKGKSNIKTKSKQNAQVEEQKNTKASDSITVSKSETPKKTNENINKNINKNTNNAPKCNHSNDKWYDSKAEAEEIYNAELKKWGDKWTNYEIDTDTYNKNCPNGYEVFSCPYCNKWTIELYY